MLCIYCTAPTRIVNSRPQKRTNSTWRRHTCISCDQTFTTIEQLDYEKSWVVQYSNPTDTTRPFLRDKLLLSIYKSLGHHGPTALPDALGITNTVMAQLQRATTNGKITSANIAVTCYTALCRFDKTAATVYKAYHSSALK